MVELVLGVMLLYAIARWLAMALGFLLLILGCLVWLLISGIYHSVNCKVAEEEARRHDRKE